MKTIYTLMGYVASEDSWHDRRGDYHKGKDSELSIQYFIDKKEAGDFYGKFKFNDEDAEITILINGMNPDECHPFLTTEEQNILSFDEEEIRSFGYKKYEELKEVKRQKEDQDKLKKQQDDEARKQKEKDNREQAERIQLAQLIAKYGQE